MCPLPLSIIIPLYNNPSLNILVNPPFLRTGLFTRVLTDLYLSTRVLIYTSTDRPLFEHTSAYLHEYWQTSIWAQTIELSDNLLRNCHVTLYSRIKWSNGSQSLAVEKSWALDVIFMISLEIFLNWCDTYLFL